MADQGIYIGMELLKLVYTAANIITSLTKIVSQFNKGKKHY
jgi:hypothetical protein